MLQIRPPVTEFPALSRCNSVLRPDLCRIAPLQVPGQTESFLQHMQLGLAAAAADPTALLVFSGGQTRMEAGAVSEAGSYENVARARNWFGHAGVAARTVTEVGRAPPS